MTFRIPFRAALAAVSLAFAVCLAAPAAAKDVYKPYLDPGIPHHRAILDTLARLEANPNDAGLKNDLGCLIALDGFWRDALREFEEAAELDEKDSRPLFNAGLVRAWQSEWGRARRAFRRAVDRDPGNWPAWWMLGYAQEQLGHREAAVDAYKVSLRTGTSLFDVEVNPFAIGTKLKARVLLETYEKRLVRAAMPAVHQLSDAERVAALLQPSTPPVAAAAPSVDEPPPATTGPVVTTAAPSSSQPTTSGPPPRSGYPGARPIPRRPTPPPEEVQDEGERRETPEEAQPKPEEVPGPGGEPAPTPDTPPGPGGFDAPARPRPTRPPS